MTDSTPASAAPEEPEFADEPNVEQTILLKPRDDGRKGYYGPDVELLLMDNGSVEWRYDYD